MSDVLCEGTKARLLKTARKLGWLKRSFRIDQTNGSISNTPFEKWFCGRCFGVVLHETLHDGPPPKTFGYSHGVKLLDELLSEGAHYKKHAKQQEGLSAMHVIDKVANYLRDFCGAPPYCFDVQNWPIGSSQAAVIRKAVELNATIKEEANE